MNALRAVRVVAQREELLELVDDDAAGRARRARRARLGRPASAATAPSIPATSPARDGGHQAGAQDRGLAAARGADDGQQTPGREPARPARRRPPRGRRRSARSSGSKASRPRYGHSVAGERRRTPGPASAWIGSGVAIPFSRCGPRSTSDAALRQVAGDDLRRDLRQEDLPAVGLGAQPRREADRRAAVVRVAPLGLAGVDAPAHRDARCRPATARLPAPAWRPARPRPRPAPSRTPTPSSRPRPSTRSGCRRGPRRRPRSARRGARARRPSPPGAPPTARVEPSMSEKQNVSTPVGSAADQPTRSRSTSSPGVFGRRAGSVAIPSRIAASSCAACAGSIPSQSGSTPAGGGARQQRERGRRQRVDVAGARRRPPRRPAPGRGSRASRRAGAACSGAEDRPKSTSLIRPPRVRIRLPGLTSPWITGGDCECRCVSASAACAR